MRPLAALAGVLLLTACRTPPPAMTEAERAQIEAEVMALEEAQAEAYTALDAQRLMGLWMDGDISSVSFGQRMAGAEELKPFLENLVAGWADTRFEWLPGGVVDVLSADAAVFQGTARQATTNQEGVGLVQQLHFTELLRKVNGAWKIQRNHVSGRVVREG